jgi:4-hydroxybenzoate polyprenyltransferase
MSLKSEQKNRGLEKIILYGRMIRFSHTVFALPFALAAVVLASRYYPLTLRCVVLILMAMVGARSAAMGFNRIADARFDSRNPRTAGREIPAGRLSLSAAWIFVAISSGVFILAAALLGDLPFYFSFPVLAVLFLYSYTKRFTWMSHLYLGFAISLAPSAAWIAVSGSFSPGILLLSLALMTYIAGFDILYACQDTEFDREQGLFSIPAIFGTRQAMRVSRFIHSLSYLSFLWIYFIFEMNHIYLMTVGLIGILFIIEHALVDPDDLNHIHIAFFHINSIISILLFAGVLADEMVRIWR